MCLIPVKLLKVIIKVAICGKNSKSPLSVTLSIEVKIHVVAQEKRMRENNRRHMYMSNMICFVYSKKVLREQWTTSSAFKTAAIFLITF